MSLLGAEAILSRKQKQPKAYCRPNECLVLGFGVEPVCVGARGRRKERGAHSLSGAGQPTPPGSLSSDQIFSFPMLAFYACLLRSSPSSWSLDGPHV